MEIEEAGDGIKYLEHLGLDVPIKVITPKVPKPPMINVKNKSTLEFLAEGCLTCLTPNLPKPFPSNLYKKEMNSTYFEQCFISIENIGEGSFGYVTQVVDREDSRLYGVKVFKRTFRNDGDRERRLREVLHHQTFSDHLNVVTLIAAWEEDRKLHMQMELCKSNISKEMAMPEKEIWKVLTDIVCILDVMHESGTAHLDIKLENILKGFDGLYKLGDFGLTYNFVLDSQWNPSEGDARYLAPELLSQGNFTFKADIFSLGMCILELAADIELPYNGRVWQAMREDIFPFERTRHLSTQLFGLIRSMLSQDPHKRPTAKEILNTPAVQKILAERSAIVNPEWNPWNEIVPYTAAIWGIFSSIVQQTAKEIQGNITGESLVTDCSPISTFCTSTPQLPTDDANNVSPTEQFQERYLCEKTGYFVEQLQMLSSPKDVSSICVQESHSQNSLICCSPSIVHLVNPVRISEQQVRSLLNAKRKRRSSMRPRCLVDVFEKGEEEK